MDHTEQIRAATHGITTSLAGRITIQTGSPAMGKVNIVFVIKTSVKHCMVALTANLIPTICMAASWNFEIKDIQTSEVKTFNYSEVKSYKIDLPRFSKDGCIFEIEEPVDTPTGGKIQRGILRCFNPRGAVFIKGGCLISKSGVETIGTILAEVIQSEESAKGKKKDLEFKSYSIVGTCRP